MQTGDIVTLTRGLCLPDLRWWIRITACHYRDRLSIQPRKDNSVGAYETKYRDREFFRGVGTSSMFYHQGGQNVTNATYTIRGRQTTTSRDNPGWHLLQQIRKEGWGNDTIRMQDVGGTFSSVSHRFTSSHPWMRTPRVNAPGAYRQYVGPQFAAVATVGPTSVYWPKITDDINSMLMAAGSTAIARTIPTNPASGVAQLLGEMKEGLPSLPAASYYRDSALNPAGLTRRRRKGKRRGRGARAGDEYLNYEFGIKPMVQDLREISSTVKRTRKLLDQLERDSGRLVRRRYEFPVQRTVTGPTVLSTNAAAQPALDTYLYADSSGVLTKETVKTVRLWFSGAYTYYYANGDTIGGKLARAEQSASRLFGTRITPELLWELTPWSWAVDWASNFGDVFHNVSAFSRDNLVLRHGYIMANITITDTYVLRGTQIVGMSPQTYVQSFTTEGKFRMQATPYGFGLNPVDFTPRQVAILAALGLTGAGKR